MKATGIIVEYNPFHNGHLYHLQQAKEVSKATVVIAIMSGNFLQRGEPALIDKFSRAKSAVLSGVDLVFELPYTYALQNAESFSKGALLALSKLNVDSLVFGSESGEVSDFLKSFEQISKYKNKFNSLVKQSVDKGLSFPAANQIAYEALNIPLDLNSPNNILGYSYVEQIKKLNLPIKPLTIKRIKNSYHATELNSSISSATSIRNHILKHSIDQAISKQLTESSLTELRDYKHQFKTLHTLNDYFKILRYRVQTTPLNELSQIGLMSEGLHHLIYKTSFKATSTDHWINLIKSKRYTRTRIQRIFIHILTQTKQSDLNLTEGPLKQIRLLAMSQEGITYLNHIKKTKEIEIVTSLKAYPTHSIERKVSASYYSILEGLLFKQAWKREFNPPFIKQ